MNITTALLLFGISYTYVAFKAVQQLAVVNFHTKWIVPVSLILAFCEVTTITVLAVSKNIWYFPVIGLGSGLGALTTMYLYKKNKERTSGQLY
ncbi:hypothetical protein barba138A_phanotate88 [Rheinheimera phage vB_RspM_barba_13-8A]|uniref:Holin n=2 Tax=Barbavirus barba18A TaxID=2734090 RepID=A0A4P8MX09_9CAUD|nr:hypothetical protein Barba3A_gp069 [Rheinheimera phage vB_RspM_Barba3A]QNO10199.1 hypothetical protein barba138A_phanotate88 [Rheinheimera phage vB_RspM_barba_13-8A]